MFDDYDHITISYHHRDDGWFEMELYLPLLVDCPKNKMPAILSQFVKDEKCEDKAKKLLAYWERQRDKYERDRKDAADAYVNISTEVTSAVLLSASVSGALRSPASLVCSMSPRHPKNNPVKSQLHTIRGSHV